MNVFFSGIGGIGMSALAELMHARGDEVSGSDRAPSVITEGLIARGIPVTTNQDGSAVSNDCDLLIYTEAMPDDAAERLIAKERGIRSISYFDALGELTKDTELIAVCGTHGKSSTTALGARMLMETGSDPSVVVGTLMKELSNKNWRAGSDLWIVEACEYKESFLHLSPNIIIVTNIDFDHHDAFPDQEAYDTAFASFFARLPNDGLIIYHGSDARAKQLVEQSGKQSIDADSQPMIPLGTPGVHMQHNAQLILALADHLNISVDDAAKAMKEYSGSWRRFEEKGTTVHNIPVIDDYGHHPAEITVTLDGMKKKFPEKRIVCVYQPHMHDRTLALWDDFIHAFSDTDLVIVPNVYDARPHREKDSVDVDRFTKEIQASSDCTAINGVSLDNTERLLRENILKEGDALIIMGAGDITDLATAMTT